MLDKPVTSGRIAPPLRNQNSKAHANAAEINQLRVVVIDILVVPTDSMRRTDLDCSPDALTCQVILVQEEDAGKQIHHGKWQNPCCFTNCKTKQKNTRHLLTHHDVALVLEMWFSLFLSSEA